MLKYSPMKKIFFLFAVLYSVGTQAQVKILFDATKAQTAGNADWVLDADAWDLGWTPNAVVSSSHTGANPQRIPTPAQSGITASTPETYWKGALSNWGIDCVKKGYTVETLPYNGSITYGNTSNAQDLSNYKVFIVDEPNIKFTTAEKTALMNFVQNGGGLFMISDHTVSDRNNDGWDSPAIWNDFMTTNSIQANPFGISFDLQNFSETSSNVVAVASDSIIHGPMGSVTQVKWSNGTSMTLTPSANSSVKAVVYKTSSAAGNSNALVAYARYGSGKVAAIGDSSPADDGTGNPNATLYNGYTGDANGNHQKLLMNITIWLATSNAVSTSVATVDNNNNVQVFTNLTSNAVCIKSARTLIQPTLSIYDLEGQLIYTTSFASITGVQLAKPTIISPGVYLAVLSYGKNNIQKKIYLQP